MKNIILDTCVIIEILGCMKNPSNSEINNNYRKLLMLAKQGKVQFLVTPKIFKEVTYPLIFNKSKAESNLNYFLKKYVKIITFNENQIIKIEKLRKLFAEYPIRINSNSKKYQTVKVFTSAEKLNSRNFADCLIYSEAVMANYSMITANLKDFQNTRFANKLLKRFEIKNRSIVYDLGTFLNIMQYNPNQINDFNQNLNAPVKSIEL